MIANKNTFFLLNFPLLSCSGKKFKMPWKSQGKLREFSFSNMWPPWFYVHLTADICRHGLWHTNWVVTLNIWIFVLFDHWLKESKIVVAVEAWFLPSETIFATSIKLLGLLPIIWCIYQISAFNIYGWPIQLIQI